MSPADVAGGITLSAAGALSGTPTVFGSFPITVTATNGVAPDAVKQLTLNIAQAGPTNVPPDFTGTPTDGTQGQAYSFSFTGITGSPAPTFSMSPADVAGGITLSAAGALSGTPTMAGSFPITVTATNGVAPDAVKQFTLVIAPTSTDVAPDFTGTPPGATVGQAYSFAFSGITGSPAPTFSVDPATIAGGITISPDGVLSGTPTTAGSFMVTVTATNGVAPDAVKQFTIEVSDVTPPPPPPHHHHDCEFHKWHGHGWHWGWFAWAHGWHHCDHHGDGDHHDGDHHDGDGDTTTVTVTTTTATTTTVAGTTTTTDTDRPRGATSARGRGVSSTATERTRRDRTVPARTRRQVRKGSRLRAGIPSPANSHDVTTRSS